MAFTFGREMFELTFPDNWQDETIYSFKGPEDSGVQHGLLVTVDREPGTDDIVRYAKVRIAALRDTLSGAEVLKEAPREMPAGHSAYEVVYKWVPCEGKIIFQKQVWALMDGVAYNFTASFSKKTIKTIGTEVDAIIDSLCGPRDPGSRGAVAGPKPPRAPKAPHAPKGPQAPKEPHAPKGPQAPKGPKKPKLKIDKITRRR